MEQTTAELLLRIDWSELDVFGHVNNVSFFKYIQAARVGYWERTGLWQLFEEAKTGPILASSACQFRKPLFYPGNVLIRSRMQTIGNSSFTLHHFLYNDTGELVAEAQDVIVWYDFTIHQKLMISSAMREQIEAFENQKMID